MHDDSKIQPKDLTGIYGELAEIIGLEEVVKIYEHFKGQQVSFPTRLYTKEFILEQIREEGTQPIKKLATQYGYSERRLRQMLKDSKKIAAKIT